MTPPEYVSTDEATNATTAMSSPGRPNARDAIGSPMLPMFPTATHKALAARVGRS